METNNDLLMLFYIQGCRRYFYVLLLYISEYIWKKLYSNIMDIRNNSSVSKLCLLNILYTLVRSQQSRLANHVTERSWRWSSFSIICPMCVILDYFREFILCNSLFSKILSLYPLLFLIIYGYYYLIAKICYKLVHGKNLLQRTKQRQCRLFVTIIIFFIKIGECLIKNTLLYNNK